MIYDIYSKACQNAGLLHFIYIVNESLFSLKDCQKALEEKDI